MILTILLGVVLTVLAIGFLCGFWPVKTDFYLYFSDESQAQAVVIHLKRNGFKVQSRFSEPQWLVMASKSVGSLKLFSLEVVLETLAVANGGEYDGYERSV